jgi:hypothetical protein
MIVFLNDRVTSADANKLRVFERGMLEVLGTLTNSTDVDLRAEVFSTLSLLATRRAPVYFSFRVLRSSDEANSRGEGATVRDGLIQSGAASHGNWRSQV